MERRALLQLSQRILRLPTAPYHEHAVRAFVEEYCRELGLPVQRDRVGNVVVKYRHRQAGAPLVFVAHMDHPGFEALGGDQAEFLGGVPKEWFPHSPVRFHVGESLIRAKITGIDERQWPQRKLVTFMAKTPVPAGAFGMWDLPAVRVHAGKLHATTIDDVLSVAVTLATLAEVKRQRLRTHVWGVFTRAEEVGFHGAVELAKAGILPRDSLVVSLEMSKARPWAKIGDGPIVRVGDRLTTFDAAGVHYLQEVARRSAIRAQRCLMDGGACEATAFNGLGYRAAGLCLPLGNYHNIGPRERIRAEYVSVDDLTGLARLTVAAARLWPERRKVHARVRTVVAEIRRRAPRRLREDA